VKIWNAGVRSSLPERWRELPLQDTVYHHVYSRPGGKRINRPSLLILNGPVGHPFELCREIPFIGWYLPCDGSPEAVQKALFETTLADRFYLSPLRMLAFNAAVFAKSSYLEGDDLETFRSVVRPEESIVWIATRDRTSAGKQTLEVDHFYVAGNNEFAHIAFIWGFPRDPALLADFLASLHVEAASEGQAAAELGDGRVRGSKHALLNALRMARDKWEPAVAVFESYRAAGTGYERAAFADWVQANVAEDGDLRFMDLIEKTQPWVDPSRRKNQESLSEILKSSEREAR